MRIMKCEDVQAALVFFLDHEDEPGQHRMIEKHLAGCLPCRERVAALAATRKLALQALQSLAVNANPSPQAWDVLQSQLAKEARPMPEKIRIGNARPAPHASRIPFPNIPGENKMRTRIAIPAMLAMIVMVVIGIFLFREPTPASAQQILDRAYQARTAPIAGKGISHTRAESYLNLQALGNKPGIERTIQDAYVDLSSGINRQVWFDAATGTILAASAYDGVYTYSHPIEESRAGEVLTLYRSPQSLDKVTRLKPNQTPADLESTFEAIRQKPDIIQVSQSTRTDGRAVYILRAQAPDAAGEKYQVKNFDGETVMIFDAQTYDLLEYSVVMQQSGTEIVLTAYRKLIDETLPAGSPVDWDMKDVKGISIVDDPYGEHTDLLPEIITPPELAAQTTSGYLLKNVPAGFTLEISAPPKQDKAQPFSYIASYTSSDQDYFTVQTGKAPEKLASLGTDRYQTASGITFYFISTVKAQGPKAKDNLLAIAVTPQNTQFIISTSLSRERVQELAEGLVLVK